MKIESTFDRVHFFNIRLLDPKSRKTIQFLSWSNLRWEIRLKYDWYFKYRAALLQVEHPKHIIETFWGNEPAVGKSLEQITALKIRSKKAKITEYKNKIARYTLEWNELFSYEDDIKYIRAIEKIEKLELELKELQKTIK